MHREIMYRNTDIADCPMLYSHDKYIHTLMSIYKHRLTD